MDALDDLLLGMIQNEMGEEQEPDGNLLDPEYGLYYPADYVLHTWNDKRRHGILPEPGGINDQDWRLVYHDWPRITERYNILFERIRNGGIAGFSLPKQGVDWQDL